MYGLTEHWQLAPQAPSTGNKAHTCKNCAQSLRLWNTTPPQIHKLWSSSVSASRCQRFGMPILYPISNRKPPGDLQVSSQIKHLFQARIDGKLTGIKSVSSHDGGLSPHLRASGSFKSVFTQYPHKKNRILTSSKWINIMVCLALNRHHCKRHTCTTEVWSMNRH